MVGTAGQDDAALSGLLQIGDDLLALLFDVVPCMFQLFPCLVGSGADFTVGNLEFLLKLFHELLREHLLIGESHERVHEFDVLFRQLLHVVFHVLRVGRDDGAVVMVSCAGHFLPLIRDAGIEDKRHVLFDEP